MPEFLSLRVILSVCEGSPEWVGGSLASPKLP
jgi:hypothetical protein